MNRWRQSAGQLATGRRTSPGTHGGRTPTLGEALLLGHQQLWVLLEERIHLGRMGRCVGRRSSGSLGMLGGGVREAAARRQAGAEGRRGAHLILKGPLGVEEVLHEGDVKALHARGVGVGWESGPAGGGTGPSEQQLSTQSTPGALRK